MSCCGFGISNSVYPPLVISPRRGPIATIRSASRTRFFSSGTDGDADFTHIVRMAVIDQILPPERACDR